MVKEDDVLEVTRQNELVNKVLFYKNDSEVKVGTPYLEDVLVGLEKLEDKKDKKVVVARFRAKSRHRRKVGHRQPISVVKVKSITAGSVGAPAEEIKTAKKKVTKKKETK